MGDIYFVMGDIYLRKSVYSQDKSVYDRECAICGEIIPKGTELNYCRRSAASWDDFVFVCETCFRLDDKAFAVSMRLASSVK